MQDMSFEDALPMMIQHYQGGGSAESLVAQIPQGTLDKIKAFLSYATFVPVVQDKLPTELKADQGALTFIQDVRQLIFLS